MNAEPADPDGIHRSLLAGLLSHIGARADDRAGREQNEFLGARNARFAISPGSGLFKKPPKWVMAAELVETNRLWARVAAGIRPEWAEELAPHLVKRSYSEPQWESNRAAASALERVTLYGLPIVTARRVDFARIDPHASRDLFLGHALVEGDWGTHHTFVTRNRALLDQVRSLEDRARRRDLLVTDDVLFDFFDRRVPESVVSGRHFDRWWKTQLEADPALLDFTLDLVIDPDAGRVDLAAFPDTWVYDDLELPLSYVFDPGAEADGVTVHVPLQILNRVDERARFDWHVPGRRPELVTALIRSLPKVLRRNFVPVPDHVQSFLSEASPADGPLLSTLASRLTAFAGDPIRPADFDVDRLADDLRMAFRIEDDNGRRVAFGRDLETIRRRLRDHLRTAVTRAIGPRFERSGIRSWNLGTLPRFVDATSAGHTVRAHPALVDEGDAVALRLFDSPDEADAAMIQGTRRLLLLGLASPLAALERLLDQETKLALAYHRHDSAKDLLHECVAAAVDDLIEAHGGPAWDEASFEALREAVRPEVVEVSLRVARTVGRILQSRHAIEARLERTTATPLLPARLDVRRQLARLVFPGFVLSAGGRRLPDLDRYLRAIEHRLDRLAQDPSRDAARMRRIQLLEERYERLPISSEELRWMLEELRVSVFAQSVGTPYRVSEERVARALDEMVNSSGTS